MVHLEICNFRNFVNLEISKFLKAIYLKVH